jgi:hypothetical protein
MNKTRLIIFSFLLCIACSDHLRTQDHAIRLNDFSKIDDKLDSIAKRLGTTVETSGGGHSFENVDVPKEKLQIRKIMWIDGNIGKAIIIDQNFENKNIDAPDWNFTNLAWLYKKVPHTKTLPFWKKDLLIKVPIQKIETDIDQLLKKSLENLSAIKESDLSDD